MRTPRALTADHWVSRGLQVNFSNPEKRVSILGVPSGKIVDPIRPVKSNFREVGFTSFINAGVPDDLLERAFASVERSVLNEIRLVDVCHRGPQQKAAVANLFAVHLVRSPSFKEFHREILRGFRESEVTELANDPSLPVRFERDFGRAPAPEELFDVVLRQYDVIARDPMTLVQTMVRQHDQMAEKLNGYHMQVIKLNPPLPGLVLGDTPVVHANTKTGQYGFRDRLALGDANLIVGPLTRWTAACFTARAMPPAIVRTRKLVERINAVFLRAASSEVACHPDDSRALRQTHSRLERLPPPLGGT